MWWVHLRSARELLLAVAVVAVACSTPPSPPSTAAASYTFADSRIETESDEPDVAILGCVDTCPPRANSVGTCASGMCAYSCLPGFFDCDGKASTGCEVNGGFSKDNCGACGQVCPGGSNGFAQCIKSVCAFTCDAGWADCAADIEGCETATVSSTDHCGDCTTACNAGPRASAVCEGGLCGLFCDPGFANCNGATADGCEAELADDPAHCGGCGIVCKDTPCVKGACVCAATTSIASAAPLDMYIMVDQSKSMDEATGIPNVNKWQAIAQALNAFVVDANSVGIGVAIQYFGLPGGGGKGSSCSIADYAKPEVPMAQLPANAAAIATSVAGHTPGGMTPTGPAVQGAISYAQSYAASNPGHNVIAVLATDGQPTECTPTDIAALANLAAAGAAATPKVLTFVIGVGTSLKNLDIIAAGGGTKQAFVLDQGGNVVQQFSIALKSIQGEAISCSYAIPQPNSGQPVDVTKLNVEVTLQGVQTMLVYVDSEGSCGATPGGWHFDAAGAPTKLVLCPATCAAVKADAKAQVDVLLGCARAQAGRAQ